MKLENEYRVRAVERFVVTHYEREERRASCSNMGEFPNRESADRVARALHERDVPSTYVTIEGEKSWAQPAPCKPQSEEPTYYQYVIVERGFDINTKAWYARFEREALQHKAQLERHYGREFRIFARELTDPVAIARRKVEVDTGEYPMLDLAPPHTTYPSLYAIGDTVVCKNHPATVVAVKFTGDGHDYPGKVIYEIRWLSEVLQPTEEFPSEDIYPAAALAQDGS
jgi:hypothetical protein